MFRGTEPQGFTIIEVMIFLTVSSILFFAVLNSISGSQAKTYFTEGVHEFANQIQLVANNVQDGYYENTNDFSCHATSLEPSITFFGPTTQGQNYGCTFIGRVIQFGYIPSGGGPLNQSQYYVYTVVGRQFEPQPPATNATTNVTNLSGALPVLLFNPNSTNEDVTTYNVPSGLVIQDVYFTDNSPASGGLFASADYDSLVGFLSSFSGLSGNGSLSDTSESSMLVPVPITKSPTGIGNEFLQQNQVPGIVAGLENDGTTNLVYSNGVGVNCPESNGQPCSVENPTGGVTICLKSTTLSNTYALITIGGNGNGNTSGNPLDIETSTFNGTTCAPS
jgi:type II secretory pathway pseudopilin PulG